MCVKVQKNLRELDFEKLETCEYNKKLIPPSNFQLCLKNTVLF